MLKNFEALKYFFDRLEELNITVVDIYYLDWLNLSMSLYIPPNTPLTNANLFNKILTIKAYNDIYSQNLALAVEVDNNNLAELDMLKKEIRQKYCYNSQKYYCQILNMSNININLTKEEFDIANIEVEYKILDEINDNLLKYIFIYFNYIHFPDPIECIVTEETNKIRQLKMKEYK